MCCPETWPSAKTTEWIKNMCVFYTQYQYHVVNDIVATLSIQSRSRPYIAVKQWKGCIRSSNKSTKVCTFYENSWLYGSTLRSITLLNDQLVSLAHWGQDRMAAISQNDIFKCIWLNEKFLSYNWQCSSICSDNGLVPYEQQAISETMSVSLPTHIDVTRPQWVIGIDHDTVCAGVVGTAIRNSTSCAGRRAAACRRHNECCSGLQYQPLQRRPYKWSLSILPRS